MNNFTYSKKGIALTKHFEGCRLKAYQDSIGKWTIGYGHTLGVKKGDVCTQEQADKWLFEDIQESANAVNSLVKVKITQNEFDALTDFVFNVGQGNFRSSTMLKMINDNNHVGAASQFQRWDKAGGAKIAGLLLRRNAESELFSSND